MTPEAKNRPEVRWYMSQGKRDALTKELYDYVQFEGSLWGSGLILEVIEYDNLCRQLVKIGRLIDSKLESQAAK